MKKKKFKIKLWMIPFTLFLIIVVYLFIGFIFTILRSNAHYDYFVEGTHWEKNCLAYRDKPRYYSDLQNTRWCLGKGEGYIDGCKEGVCGLPEFREPYPYRFIDYKPTRSDYFLNIFYYGPQNYNGNFFTTLFFWPLHFIGVDMIHFRSIAGIWILR